MVTFILFVPGENNCKKHFEIIPGQVPRHPLESIKFRLEKGQVDDKEPTKISGGPSRKSEILRGKRKLSLNMIKELHEKLKIPAEIMIAAYKAGSGQVVKGPTRLHGNRHNRYMAGKGKFPGIDFKKLVDKALLFRNRYDRINFFGFRKTGDAV